MVCALKGGAPPASRVSNLFPATFTLTGFPFSFLLPLRLQGFLSLSCSLYAYRVSFLFPATFIYVGTYRVSFLGPANFTVSGFPFLKLLPFYFHGFFSISGYLYTYLHSFLSLSCYLHTSIVSFLLAATFILQGFPFSCLLAGTVCM